MPVPAGRQSIAGIREIGEIPTVEPGHELAELLPKLDGLIVGQRRPIVRTARCAELVHVEQIGQDRLDVHQPGIKPLDTHRVELVLAHAVIPSRRSDQFCDSRSSSASGRVRHG